MYTQKKKNVKRTHNFSIKALTVRRRETHTTTKEKPAVKLLRHHTAKRTNTHTHPHTHAHTHSHTVFVAVRMTQLHADTPPQACFFHPYMYMFGFEHARMRFLCDQCKMSTSYKEKTQLKTISPGCICMM